MKMASYFPPLVVAGCSGAGKGTLIAKLMAWDPEAFGFSVSHTTRAPRPGEEDGVHYHFAEVDTCVEIKAEIEQGKPFCRRYLEVPTSTATTTARRKPASEDVQKAGKICVLDIDYYGSAVVEGEGGESGREVLVGRGSQDGSRWKRGCGAAARRRRRRSRSAWRTRSRRWTTHGRGRGRRPSTLIW